MIGQAGSTGTAVVVGGAINRMLGRWLPEPCLACGEAAPAGGLCGICRQALAWNACACARCALPLPRPEPLCGRCLRRPPPQSATLAPLHYAEPVDQLLTTLKFGQRLAAGRCLSALLLELPALQPFCVGLDLAIPVPLHTRRLRERGYNQALELLRPIAATLMLPLAPAALRRCRHTPPQTGLDGATRRRNLRGAFDIDAAALRDRRVLLMDDVVTTGATVSEAARALLRGGAREVRVLAAARVATR